MGILLLVHRGRTLTPYFGASFSGTVGSELGNGRCHCVVETLGFVKCIFCLLKLNGFFLINCFE